MERFDITIRMYSADASGTQYVWDKVPAEEGDFVLYTDAQATIAALQARVQELEADPYKQGFADALEKVASDWASKEFRGHDEIQSCEVQAFLDTRHVHYEECRGVKPLQSQLTQRTAELEAANKLLYRKNCALGRAETIINDLQAELERVRERVGQRGLEVVMIGKVGHYVSTAVKEELERVRADNKALDKWRADVTVALQRPEGAFFVDVPQHIKDLVKERDSLRTLIAALPKVEGEIMVSESLVLAEDPDMCSDMSDKDEAMAYAALLKHRQGMEG